MQISGRSRLALVVAFTLIVLLWHSVQASSRLKVYALNKIASADHFIPGNIALGADGSVWLSEMAGHRIAYAARTGKLTVYDLPAPFSQIQDLVCGPDGNAWFTETNTYDGSHNYIGRVSPTGRFSIFPLRRSDAFLMGLVAGSDGNLWFTEFGAHRIGRISVNGRISEFVLQKDAAPQAIVRGRDGNIWTVSGTSVVRISPTGGMTYFHAPRGRIRNISASSGNSLWLTYYNSTNLVEIDPKDGSMHVFSEPREHFGFNALFPGPRKTAVGFNQDMGAILAISDDAKISAICVIPGRYPDVESIALSTANNRLWFTMPGEDAYGYIQL